MNNINELVSHGISISTAEKMIEECKRRIGTMNGIYEITDIAYDFTEKGKDVTLRCAQCGKVIHRMMIKGRNKWSELIKTCDCQKEQKKRESEIAEKIKKEKIREEIGKEYGDYIVQDVIFGNPDKLLMKCKECGSEIFVSYQNVKSGKWQNSTCEKHKKREFKYNRSYIGQKNNYLTVIDIVRDKENRVRFLCKCDCGNTKILQPCYWENGRIKSCGCMHGELVSTHGGSKDRLYKVWQGMKRRCYNKYCEEYDNYGGRGISICEEWRNDYQAFKEWAYSHGYDDKAKKGVCTIDRINVNGNYEPSNCRWISNSEQQKNKRPRSETKNGGYRVFISLNGELVSRKEACRKANIDEGTFKYRVNVKGMSNEMALETKKSNGKGVNLRLGKDMKQWLFQKSEIEQKSVSQVIRDIIAEKMSGCCENEQAKVL